MSLIPTHFANKKCYSGPKWLKLKSNLTYNLRCIGIYVFQLITITALHRVCFVRKYESETRLITTDNKETIVVRSV